MANSRNGFGVMMTKLMIPIVWAGVVGYLVRDLDLKTLVTIMLILGVWAVVTAWIKIDEIEAKIDAIRSSQIYK